MASVFSFPAEHYATLLLLFLACVAVTVFAVDRQRHGEPFLIRMPKLELTRFTTRRPRSEQPFATPGQAQFWFGMRRTGTHLLLASFALALIAFFGFLFLNTYGHYQGRAGIFWLAALGMSPISLLVIGAEWQIGLQRQQGAIRMSTFDAAQCMDNSGLAFSKLAVLITSVCLGWIVLAATATIWIALWGGIGPWLESGQSIIAMLAQLSALTWTCIALVAIVKFVTMGAMLITSGLMLPLRPKSSIAILTVMAGYLYAAIWDARHGWLLRPVWEIHAWLVAAVLVVGTCLLLKKAIGEGHLAKRRYVPAFGLWIAYVGAGLALWLSGMSGSLSVPLSVTVLTLGILTLPLASVAMLPLALSAHRHR